MQYISIKHTMEKFQLHDKVFLPYTNTTQDYLEIYCKDREIYEIERLWKEPCLVQKGYGNDFYTEYSTKFQLNNLQLCDHVKEIPSFVINHIPIEEFTNTNGQHVFQIMNAEELSQWGAKYPKRKQYIWEDGSTEYDNGELYILEDLNKS